MSSTILTINAGSSSLKFGLYGEGPALLFEGEAAGLGHEDATLTLKDADGREVRRERAALADTKAAFQKAAKWLPEFRSSTPTAIGHRVVHGGPHLTQHQRITPQVLEQLKAAEHFAPLHIPPALELIELTEKLFPGVAQFACFDTAFHITLPEVAARFPLPRSLYDEGVRRYGFHGLSYESILQQLGTAAPARLVIAHLGSGASLCAVRDGRSVDTTMGLTPTGGIPMGTRSGDLDPGVLLFLLRTKGLNADALEQMLDRESGLTGLSGGEADMRKLQQAAAAGDAAAMLAIGAFVTAVRKTIAGYVTVLGGLDLLVFTGGIGEHASDIRERVLAGMGWNATTLPAREDLQIARHCLELA